VKASADALKSSVGRYVFTEVREKVKKLEQMSKIGGIIADEFGLNNFKVGSFLY
jgi:hypothetical protein